MTDEEKSKAVSDFCDNFFDVNETGCFGCPLAKDGGKCPDRSDEEIYDILVKAGLIAPDDEIETSDDKVNHPNHYCKGGIECIDAIRASMTKEAFAGYCKGNVIKYVFRYEQKGGKESLEKAMVYLKWLIETEDGCQNGQE